MINIDDFKQTGSARGENRARRGARGGGQAAQADPRYGDGTRTVIAGIKSAYAPEKLEGRLTSWWRILRRAK